MELTGNIDITQKIVMIYFASLASRGVRRALALLMAVMAVTFSSGCATITRGTREALVVETIPAGAQVRLSNGSSGTSPSSFKVKRKGDLVVTISKPGYEPVTVKVTTQIAGAAAAGMAGNVLLGGVIGVGVDAFSGGMLEHKPNPVKVTLVPTHGEPAVGAPEEAEPSPPPAPRAAEESGTTRAASAEDGRRG